jgi:heme oxygenase (biliverdin-IX-beta and delta-forming)
MYGQSRRMEQIIAHLRSATAADHVRLEAALQLLAPPLSRARFVAALRGFHAFHSAWEPEVVRLLGQPDWLAPRRKLALLDDDLAGLSATPLREPVAVDLDFLTNAAAAWGSLYVMEGASLGGQVISRALQGVDWAPAAGLAYFNPYGVRTGAMWATFRRLLAAAAADLDPGAVASAARATFATVEHVIAACAEDRCGVAA